MHILILFGSIERMKFLKMRNYVKNMMNMVKLGLTLTLMPIKNINLGNFTTIILVFFLTIKFIFLFK